MISSSEAHEGQIQQRSSFIFQSFLQTALVSSSGMGKDFPFLMLSIQHFFCRPEITHPPRCPEGWFKTGCCDVYLAQTMQNFISWQLPEEVPVNLQGNWSCCVPSCWSCAQNRKCGEVFSCNLVSKAWMSQQAGSMFHSLREGWRWQEPCRAWTCSRNWWCYTARPFLVWPLLPLPRQSWCGLLLSRCHPCTGLLPGTWNWSSPLTSGCSFKYLHWCCYCCWSRSCSFLCRLPFNMPLLCLPVYVVEYTLIFQNFLWNRFTALLSHLIIKIPTSTYFM